MLYPIIYRDNLLDATEYLKPIDQKSRFNNTIGLYASIVKSTEWAYEREWRLVMPFGIFKEEVAWRNMPLPKAVFLGARIQDKHRNEIGNIFQGKNFPIMQAVPSKAAFSLTFERLSASGET